jgi:ppGpp synthetase/RelA/SpoT-type nucleotidyltranferase
MPLPTSREQIKRLGSRIASADVISDPDLHLLEELVACHGEALAIARPRLDGLGADVGIDVHLHITHRAKTTQTIIEKLRREQGMSLARMQDIAGIRIVATIEREDQDRLAAEVARRFPADPREPRIIDRRERASFGYRAVHVIVSLDDITIEIQVRTLPQHVWAELMERLADVFGRQIRYGMPPTPSGNLLGGQRAAELIVDIMMKLSDGWAKQTTAEVLTEVPDLEQVLADLLPRSGSG